jgi:AAA domain, putative AbiEii toxin, Type IV TA system
MKGLRLQHVAQIRDADVTFGDLTVLVGPQATGKSIFLQFLKLLLDTGYIQQELRRYGLDWSRDLSEFLNVFFGEGMGSIWNSASKVSWHGASVDLRYLARRIRKANYERLFFIPAQRVLTLRDGWPRPFTDYSAGDPFSVRNFSEELRSLMEDLSSGATVFPLERRLKRSYRTLLQQNIFSRFTLTVDKARTQKRLVLGRRGKPLPYMVWSAGQREFVPLLLGLYWAMPPAAVARRDALEWVVIEEPEMGLHPQAISVVLLLVLELLNRNYRVCLSTHSPQVLELVWALNRIRERRGTPRDVLDLFQIDETLRPELGQVAQRATRKRLRVYFFERSGGVRDISRLDPSSAAQSEATWGNLSEFSERANEVVARVSANSRES